MRLSLSKSAGVVLAAMGCVFAWLLAYGAPVAAAVAYPVVRYRRPVTMTPMTTTEAVVAVVVVGAAVAIALYLLVRSARRTRVAEVKRLSIRHELEQKRRAA